MKKDIDSVFWTTLCVAFVLLVHNGREPVFVIALALIPFLALLFLRKPNLWPLAICLLFFGALGRYTRYFRQTYASDTLLAIKDHIGYFISGKNVYDQIVMAQSGPTPFTYLPFSLFWYLPARLLSIDLRWFEMLVSAVVPVLVFWYGRILKTWGHLPVVAVVALTPFVLDLSADGSNDNSAVFLSLLALVLFALGKDKRVEMGSAIMLGLAASFKHYLAFFLIFFVAYFIGKRMWRYLGVVLLTIGVMSLPFVLASPAGFFRSLFFIEIGNFHTVWGWNIWVALRDGLGIVASRQHMWLVRTASTGAVALGLLKFYRLKSIRHVLVAGSTTMVVYLMMSDWTTYAYFTFLVPLIGLAAVEEVKSV